MDRYGSLALWRFGRMYLACRFKGARNFDAELAQNEPPGLIRVVVDEDVVTVRPQTRLAPNEVPDQAHRGRPSHANLIRRDLAPNRRQPTGLDRT